jgi:pre-mRNA-processing factor 19
VKVHQGEVNACSIHATGDYWITASSDGTWAFHDIATSTVLSQVEAGAACTSVSFHPDGLILGTGTALNDIKIWDIKTQKNVASFEGHSEVVSSISFSENG